MPNVKHIRVFGSIADAYMPKQKRDKLDLRTEQAILIGSVPGKDRYKVMKFSCAFLALVGEDSVTLVVFSTSTVL